MPSSDSSRDVVLERLAEEFIARHRKGEHPPLSEYTQRYPDLAADIREVFPALVQIEQLKPATDQTGAFEPAVPSAGPKLERLGDYRILREAGRGGMGVVYEAEQESLGRHVALKVLPSSALLNPVYLERFRREAKAAAKLHHTNIVPVFGVGEADGLHFYAMQFIRGEGLDRVLADVRRLRLRPGEAAPGTVHSERSIAHSLLTGQFAPPAPDAAGGPAERPAAPSTSGLSVSGTEADYCRGVARIGLQVAEALAYAHRQGILHRDIKPSNLLLDAQGTVWVTDFGLAKAEGADELTQAGDIVGTIRFMAPERFEGRSLPQSDVYSLGVTLYELLTLRPAFDHTNKAKLIDKVVHEPPLPPRKVDPRIPRDLETVVLKCLAKDPRARYASAEAVAEDLKRFLADRPIRARRATAREHLWRWCRRNPAVACLLAAVALSLLLGTVVASVFAVRAEASARQAKQDRDRARAAEREGKRKLLMSYLSDADATRMSRRPGQRFNSLRRVREALEVGREIGLTAKDKLKLRNVAIAALCLPDLEPGPQWSPETDGSVPEGIDPVHRRQARGWSVIRQLLKKLPPPATPLHGFSWDSPDGRFIAVPAEPYNSVAVKVRVWRIDGERPVAVFDLPDPVHEEAVSFRPDGRHVAFGHADGAVSIYDLETGKSVRRLAGGGAGRTFCLAYHPTLPRLAVANGNQVTVWDAEAGKRLVRMPQPATVIAVAWHPRGHRLAVGSGWHNIQLWDVETGRPVTGLWEGATTGGIRLTFDHSGDRVVSNDWGNTVRLWDAANGQLLLSQSGSQALSRFGSDDRSLGTAPAGEHLGVSSAAGTHRVAEGREQRMLLRPTPHGPEPILDFSLHPRGRLLAAVVPTGLGFFDLLTREEVGFVAGNFARLGGFDSTGALWTMGGAGLARWPVQLRDSANLLRIGPPEWVANGLLSEDYDFNRSSDGRIVTVPLSSNGTRVIQRGPPRRTLRLGPQNAVRWAPVSPEGRWVVTLTHGYDSSGVRLKVWEAATGRYLASLPAAEAFNFHGFSPDSRWLYVSSERGKAVRRLEIASLTKGGRANAPAGPAAPVWRDAWKSEEIVLKGGLVSPDQRLRAYGTPEGGIRLVEAETNEEVARIPPPADDRMRESAFSPDGSLLLARGGEKRVLYIFDLYLIRKQLAELDLDWDNVQPLPRPSKDFDLFRAKPLRVELIEAESAGSREKMAEAERRRAANSLFFNPFDAEAHFRLGRSLSVTGKHQEAYAHLTEALTFDPNLEEALSLRARVAWRLKRWDEAAADASRYLAKVPFDHQTRLLRARSNRARKRFKDAVTDYTALRTTFPGSAVICDERAECYEALGKPNLAKADREESRKLGGTGAMALNNEAWRLVTGPAGGRDPAKALELIRKALGHGPEDAIYLNTLGVVQYRNGLYREAADTLQKSLAAGQGQWDAFDLYFLAMCHAKLGDAAKAKDCFNRAVKWAAGQKGLAARHAEELKAFRAEAEELLRNAPRTK